MNQDILTSLADNPPLMNTVKELILQHLSLERLNGGRTLSADQADIVLGQMVRARLIGIKAVEDAFAAIASHKSLSTSAPRQNPGA